MSVNWAQLLKDRPDVQQEYTDESSRDPMSQAYLRTLGITTPEQYAEYWYNNMGGNQQYNPTPAGPATPQAAPTPVTATNPGANTVGTGAGASQAIPTNRENALAMARALGRLRITNRGLNYDEFAPSFEQQLQDIYGAISPTDTNPGSYFSSTLADDFLSGEQNRRRSNYRNTVNSRLGGVPLNYSSLDASISRILGEQSKESEDMLDRASKRGQFNEVGLGAARGKLDQAKTRARARLKGVATDLFRQREGDFKDIYGRALSQASNFNLGDNFDITPFENEFGRLSESINTSLEGDLYEAIGDEDLIDFNTIRQAGGKAQGAINLPDGDLMDSLAKRKKANATGRGLSTQGAF